MSLFLSPLVLFLLGAVIARLSKARRVWRRHSLFTLRLAALVLLLYTFLELALLLDVAWTHGIYLFFGADSGPDWVIDSGVFPFEAEWPLEDRGVVAYVVLSFMLFPLWMYLGVMASYWMFGRSPKQTGIIGLLR